MRAREWPELPEGGGLGLGPPDGTSARLTRASATFVPHTGGTRRFRAEAPGRAELIAVERWHEGSLGDPLHKLMLVRSGQLDIEGAAGGWLVVRGHMIFLPADRQFNLRADGPTVVQVAHLDPGDRPWMHEGCWVSDAPMLAREMLAYLLRREPGEEAAAQACRTLSFLCGEWFANPRMLFVPAARSPEIRAMVAYIRDDLETASVGGAAQAAGLAARTLHHRCLRETGFGPRALIREIRIMRAMELLAQDGPTLPSVAAAVGFASLPSFTAAFSDRLGVTPSDFVRRLRAVTAG